METPFCDRKQAAPNCQTKCASAKPNRDDESGTLRSRGLGPKMSSDARVSLVLLKPDESTFLWSPSAGPESVGFAEYIHIDFKHPRFQSLAYEPNILHYELRSKSRSRPTSLPMVPVFASLPCLYAKLGPSPYLMDILTASFRLCHGLDLVAAPAFVYGNSGRNVRPPI